MPSFVSDLDPTLLFKGINLATGILIILGGISQIFLLSFQSVVLGFYIFAAGAAILALEFRTPPVLVKYCSFLFSFIGRGVFYVFIGALLFHSNTLRIIAASVVGLIGIAFVGLEFVPSVDLPPNMAINEYDQPGDTV